MAKTKKPADPLLTAAMPTDARTMPALSGQAIPIGGNSVSAADPLARGIRQRRILQRRIDDLNTQKSAVLKELARQGYSKFRVKATEKALKIDPVIRAEEERLNRLYLAATQEAMTLLEAQEPEAAEAADE